MLNAIYASGFLGGLGRGAPRAAFQLNPHVLYSKTSRRDRGEKRRNEREPEVRVRGDVARSIGQRHEERPQHVLVAVPEVSRQGFPGTYQALRASAKTAYFSRSELTAWGD